MRGQPVVGKPFRAVDLRDQPHIAVDGQDVGIAGEDGTQGVVVFRALAVDDVRPDFTKLFPRRPDTALIARAEPAEFGQEDAAVALLQLELLLWLRLL